MNKTILALAVIIGIIGIWGAIIWNAFDINRQDRGIEELKEREYVSVSLPTATSSLACIMVKKVLREGVDSIGWFGAMIVEDIFKEAGGNPNMSINDVLRKRGIDPDTCEVLEN